MTGARTASPSRCAGCGTELPPHALSCGVCGTLVYSAKLKELAATAERESAAGDLGAARAAWEEALRWLPPSSPQSSAIQQHVADLIKQGAKPAASATPDTRPWWKRGAAGLVGLLVLALTKLKFLLLGFTKIGTLLSMAAFAGLYWDRYGWPLAIGFAISIYIHEMGHVVALQSKGIEASAPMFIPGIGAFILAKKEIDDPRVDAYVGLAGPVWGLGATLAAFGVYRYTGVPVWAAIARLSAIINLFNLLPFWQLDGARGFHSLVAWQRWVIVGTLGAAFYLTGQRILLLIGIVAIYKAFQRPSATEPDERSLGTFMILIAALSWLSMLEVPLSR